MLTIRKVQIKFGFFEDFFFGLLRCFRIEIGSEHGYVTRCDTRLDIKQYIIINYQLEMQQMNDF